MTHVVAPGEILTYSGKYVTPLALKPEQVDIGDIAHALSMQCRFSGHVSQFYSVAQHSVLCVDYLRQRGYPLEIQQQALLHDAAEAYLQDMARPLKEENGFGEAYRDAEFEIELVIAEVYGHQFPYDPAVKHADLALLALERARMMSQNGIWKIIDAVEVPDDIEIRSWPPEMAKTFFLREFERLFIYKEDTVEGKGLFNFEPPSSYADAVEDDRLAMAISPVPVRHPNSARFHELLGQVGATHDRKQQDYGKGDDPFANVRASEEWGVDGWVGAMVRLNDKVRRLQSLRTKGYLANESALDSFMDIAVYALIAYVLYEQDAAKAA